MSHYATKERPNPRGKGSAADNGYASELEADYKAKERRLKRRARDNKEKDNAN